MSTQDRQDNPTKHIVKLIPMWIPIVIGNLIPLYGVLFWGWDIFAIFFLYWIENIIIGFFTVVKILCIGASGFLKAGRGEKIARIFYTPFIIGFFTFHYGMFCMGHLTFIKSFFYEGPLEGDIFGPSETLSFTFNVAQDGLMYGIIGLFIIELLRTSKDLLSPNQANGIFPELSKRLKSRKNAHLSQEVTDKFALMKLTMFAPYGRIIVLHLTIIFGGILAEKLGTPLWTLGLLIVLKIAYDLGLIHPIRKTKHKKKVR